mmetsp:Transcript_9185/g.17978  ORF Transcript_9185/g.17978 Transcript_9185/m.17978 type:complete len:206 (+) Transcript_9185:2534-3151(+)
MEGVGIVVYIANRMGWVDTLSMPSAASLLSLDLQAVEGFPIRVHLAFLIGSSLDNTKTSRDYLVRYANVVEGEVAVLPPVRVGVIGREADFLADQQLTKKLTSVERIRLVFFLVVVPLCTSLHLGNVDAREGDGLLGRNSIPLGGLSIDDNGSPTGHILNHTASNLRLITHNGILRFVTLALLGFRGLIRGSFFLHRIFGGHGPI